MAPVRLQMDVHCYGCAKKIRKAIENIPGVDSVTASFETNVVEVTGSANAQVLKTRLEIKMRKSVTILSYGVDDAPAPARRAPSPAPPAPAPPTSPPYYTPTYSPPNYSPPPQPRRNNYSPPPQPRNNYNYGYYPPNYPPPPQLRNNDGYYENYGYYPYAPDGSLAFFSDENPEGCTIQ